MKAPTKTKKEEAEEIAERNCGWGRTSTLVHDPQKPNQNTGRKKNLDELDHNPEWEQ